MARRTAVPLLALALLLCAAVSAQAELVSGAPVASDGQRQARSAPGPVADGPASSASKRLLWATVNVCDTPRFPDAMGIRASMPGNGSSQRMYMRFSVQSWSSVARQWLDVPSARSRWMYAGSARFRARQTGYTFRFAPPPAGGAYVLRGAVEYQWRSPRRRRQARRSGYRLARRRTTLTESGIGDVRGGDPSGTSKAMCMVANLGV